MCTRPRPERKWDDPISRMGRRNTRVSCGADRQRDRANRIWFLPSFGQCPEANTTTFNPPPCTNREPPKPPAPLLLTHPARRYEIGAPQYPNEGLEQIRRNEGEYWARRRRARPNQAGISHTLVPTDQPLMDDASTRTAGQAQLQVLSVTADRRQARAPQNTTTDDANQNISCYPGNMCLATREASTSHWWHQPPTNHKMKSDAPGVELGARGRQ
ncbi:hypothetical protein BDV93DRAFT_503224 [Ceratobasidium sp. AG-I]|nr:hypothetical protein BDV93DRAFT_503224 [Ceratobasidium sp. AG-I]